jgi:hypothetical protein
MHSVRFRCQLVVCCTALLVTAPQAILANTLCVKPGGGSGCYAKIQLAVNAAAMNDVIKVAAGVYKEDVVVGKSLSLIGAAAGSSIIDATGLANGIFVDGFDHPGLNNVIIAGFTVKNAMYEGLLVVNASDVTIRDNHILHNDLVPHTFGSGAACKGQPPFETDESGDCGGGLHFIAVSHSIASGNLLRDNADGILISDETGESFDNLLVRNVVTENPEECGIVLASHPPINSAPPFFAPHFGIDHNTVSENVVSKNGVKVGGAGVGLFSDGAGPGRVSENVIIRNQLSQNGIPGVSLHSHVGPAFGAPADDMNNNMIIGNFIWGNGADGDDTATPGRAGININSGGGGTPILGTLISQNVIYDEDVDVAVNDPVALDVHLNDLKGGKIGVANVCALDNPKNPAVCTGRIDATQNYWGCAAGPGGAGCSTTSGANIRFTPWVEHSVAW